MRLKYAFNFRLFFWTWDIPWGYASLYYDGWNNQFNFKLFCICWMTPALEGDL